MSAGLHHITAISGAAQATAAFYTGALGLRLVKKTVNFDDPQTYHLYFGDAEGSPGTILTFFPWEHAGRGRAGTGEASLTAFRVPEGALPFWADRLARAGATLGQTQERFGETLLPVTDPDGMRLALVEVAGAHDAQAWAGADIGGEHAIRGFHGVTLDVRDPHATAGILAALGFVAGPSEGNVTRFIAPGAPMGAIVDVHAAANQPQARGGRGSVHHVAFRAADDAAQAAMAARITDTFHLPVTGQKDRNYFRSVYFREPNGVLFEIATDAPGFAIDEPAASLGQSLKLPPALEAQRGRIEAVLPALA